MCGICGFTGVLNQTIETQSVLTSMVESLRHRGPDDSGFFQTEGVALGMRRLSIQDLDHGRQPMVSEDEQIALVFNGEIINHQPLRGELERRGFAFRSHNSDAEVVLHLYQCFGEAFLSKLNGQFAIALWDNRKKSLLLARDRTGIKPLYYAVVEGSLLFASEIKALFQHPRFSKQPNVSALHHYFTFKNIPAPMTAFAGVKMLRPGERLWFSQGQADIKRWWTPTFESSKNGMGERAAASTLHELLSESVRLNLQADVPVGAYLSGGLDSSAVVAYMRHHSEQPIKTFSLIYSDEVEHKRGDRDAARKVSRRFNTEHYEVEMSAQSLLSALPHVVDAFDEPFCGVISTYFISQLACQHVKVVLSGDGADELFGSYLAHRLAQPLDRLLSGEPYESVLPSVCPRDRARFDELLQRADSELDLRMQLYLSSDERKKQYQGERLRGFIDRYPSSQMVREILDQSATADALNRALAVDFSGLLPDQVLTFSDRLSMAHGVEVRPPFLENSLVDFATRLPGAYKIKEQRVKHILKEAVKGLLPSSVVNRPKEGFILPINQWMSAGNLLSFIQDTLSEERLRRHDVLKVSAVTRSIKRLSAEQRADDAPLIWSWVMFQLWWDRHFA